MLVSLAAFLLAQLASSGDTYRWIGHDHDPGRLYLYRGDTQIGGYDLESRTYRAFDGQAWGEYVKPPIDPPSFGVIVDKLQNAPRYFLNGESVTQEQAQAALERGLPEDGGKLRLTIIGPDEARKAARKAIEEHPEFAAFRDQVIVKDYAADHWAVAPGFVTTGAPTIYCQAPSGKVLHRQDDFGGGADTAIAALRRARDAYQPRLDPDLRLPWRWPWRLPELPRGGTLMAAAAAGIGLRLLFNRITSSKGNGHG